MSSGNVALYGKVALVRARCKACRAMAIVIDGRFQCCEAVADVAPNRVKRMSQVPGVKKRPTRAQQAEILTSQDYRCFYCGLSFGSTQIRKGKAVRLSLNWDHVVPFSFSMSNSEGNMVAACQVCNNLKRDRIFQTLDEARVALRDMRLSRGYLV